MAAERGCRRGSFLFLIAAAAALAGCVGVLNPVTGEEDWSTVTEQDELALGAEAHQQLLKEHGYYDDPALQAYVAEVGERLLPHTHRPDFPYQFTVLDSEVVNAFATPGYVYVTRGILAQLQSEAELAALLGHELAHITARHTARQIGQRQTVDALGWLVGRVSGSGTVRQAADLLGAGHLSKYSRDAEREADRLGAEYAAAAGYDPAAMRNLLRGLRDLERMRAAAGKPDAGGGLFATYLATHPRTGERLEDAKRAAAGDGGGRIGRDEYLRQIDGLAVGPDPALGLLRDSWFFYSPDRVALRPPRGWTVSNLPDRLDMRSPDESRRLTLFLFERRPEHSACDFLAAHYEGRARPRQVGAYPGCVMATRGGGEPTQLFAAAHAAGGVLVFALQPPAAGRHRRAVAAGIDSLRAMTEEELQAARPAWLRVRAAAAGERYEDLARGAGWHEHPAAWLRMINGDWPGGEPAAGQPVKTVVQ